MRKLCSFFLFSLLTTLFLSQIVHADIYIKQKRHSDEMNFMGQSRPAEDVVEEIWMSEKGFRTDSGHNTMIMLFAEKKMRMIDHEKKTYSEMPMDFEKLSSQMMEGQSEEDMEKMQGMMQNMMKIEANVQVTDEKKKIKEWNCQKYILNLKMMMGTTTQEIWATEEIEVDESVYDKAATSVFSMMPGMQNAMGQLMEEMKKIKGVHVKTITSQNIMNQTFESSTELISFEKKPVPDDTFSLPSGYDKQSMR